MPFLPVAAAESGLSPSRIGEGESLDDVISRGAGTMESFAGGVRQAVAEIARVVDALNHAPELTADIPYLGSLHPADIGGITLVDTASLQSLFNLTTRFEAEIVEPLDTFLTANPNASVPQLVSQFDFLEPVSGLADGRQGVKLNFVLDQTFDSSLAALIEPITSQADSLLDAVDGDALAGTLPFDLTLNGFAFDIVGDAEHDFEIELPTFDLGLDLSSDVPVDFAARLGFLAGAIQDGILTVDAGLRFEPRLDFGPAVSLDALAELSSAGLQQVFSIQPTGDGLDARLPFDFDLAGFATDGFLPIFSANDSNLFDGILPRFDLEVPRGAPYDAEALLGFTTIDSTSVLATLDEIAAAFLGWETGDLLNHSLPLGEGVTLADVAGFADSYAGAVSQFLKTTDGLPTFNSIQELTDLIPSLSAGANEFVRYDAASRTLTLDISAVWQPDPIVAQANLDLIAGQEDSPLGALAMTPRCRRKPKPIDDQPRCGIRLRVADRLERASTSQARSIRRVVLRDRGRWSRGRFIDTDDARWSTPMTTILDRLGLSQFVGVPQTLRVTLDDGTEVSAEMGVIDETVTIGEWLERGTVTDFNGRPLMTLQYEPAVIAGMPYDATANRFAVVDHTSGTDRVEIKLHFDDPAGFGFNETDPIDDPDVFWAETVGEARRFAMRAAADHLEWLIAESGDNGTIEINVEFERLPSTASADDRGILAYASAVFHEPGGTGFGSAGLTYPAALANHLNGGAISRIDPNTGLPVLTTGPVVNMTFLEHQPWDYDVTQSVESGSYNLFKVGTHEILHGLGIAKGLAQNGSYVHGLPNVFDSFVSLSDSDHADAGATLTPITDSSLTQADRAAARVSNRLYFTGLAATIANPVAAGTPVQLFAPTDFVAGSSGSHVDTDLFTPHGETMTHAVGAYDRQPIGVTELSRAILTDLGYAAPTTATTTVTSTGLFWETLFDHEPFEVPVSVSLNELDDDSPLKDPATSLARFYSPGTAGLDQAPPSLTLTLADGSEYPIELAPISQLTVGDILAAVTIGTVVTRRRKHASWITRS